MKAVASTEPTASVQAVDSAVLVTRAGSQANRYSIELGEAVRALVRATAAEPAIPASELMVVLGHLSTAGYGLAQGLQQLAACLGRSTEQGLYWAAGEDADWSEVAAAHLVGQFSGEVAHGSLAASGAVGRVGRTRQTPVGAGSVRGRGPPVRSPERASCRCGSASSRGVF